MGYVEEENTEYLEDMERKRGGSIDHWILSVIWGGRGEKVLDT